MKIDTTYGGLGLTQVYYNKALALVGSANPAIGALLSAHQSIGVPQPLKMLGTREQKDTFLPRCARTDISAFLLTEPDVGSDPARPATTDLSGHLRYVERTARKLARSTVYAMSRWQGRMETKQGFLGRIVDIGAELFAMSAACVRAEHLRAEDDPGREAYQLADAFCRQSRIRVEELSRPPVEQHGRRRPQGRQRRAGRRVRVA
ncbi:hypothetical protein STENM327S_02498 [Streptomyces tendae]